MKNKSNFKKVPVKLMLGSICALTVMQIGTFGYIYYSTSNVSDTLTRQIRSLSLSQSQFVTLDGLSQAVADGMAKASVRGLNGVDGLLDENAPIEEKQLEYISLSEDAERVLKYNKETYFQNLRNEQLEAKVQEDIIVAKNKVKNLPPPMTTPFPSLLSQVDEEGGLPTISISDQMNVQSLISINGKTEALVKYGFENVPLYEGMKFNGVEVLEINDKNITLSENGKKITRSLEQRPALIQEEKES